ncbi:MAG: hypothetical protein ACLFPX_00715 [Candidatus Omnitrophota bacterium]
MSAEIMSSAAKEKIARIHRLSKKYNQAVGMPHALRLLDLIDQHAAEIRELYDRGDPHYLTETGDLLILCYELLLTGGADSDRVTETCFGRYEYKLTELLDDLNVK